MSTTKPKAKRTPKAPKTPNITETNLEKKRRKDPGFSSLTFAESRLTKKNTPQYHAIILRYTDGNLEYKDKTLDPSEFQMRHVWAPESGKDNKGRMRNPRIDNENMRNRAQNLTRRRRTMFLSANYMQDACGVSSMLFFYDPAADEIRYGVSTGMMNALDIKVDQLIDLAMNDKQVAYRPSLSLLDLVRAAIFKNAEKKQGENGVDDEKNIVVLQKKSEAPKKRGAPRKPRKKDEIEEIEEDEEDDEEDEDSNNDSPVLDDDDSGDDADEADSDSDSDNDNDDENEGDENGGKSNNGSQKDDESSNESKENSHVELTTTDDVEAISLRALKKIPNNNNIGAKKTAKSTNEKVPEKKAYSLANKLKSTVQSVEKDKDGSKTKNAGKRKHNEAAEEDEPSEEKPLKKRKVGK